MTNKKIIVKGCPALLNDDVVENGCFLKSVGDEDFFCKDYMDCKIKQFLQRLYSIVVNDAKTNQSCSVFFEFFNATRILDLQEVPE